MSDSDNSDLSPLDILLKKHRKEKKDLQAKIQILKKSKGDKKKKKEVTEEIASLESEINDRHTKELEEFNNSTKTLENEETKNNTTAVNDINDSVQNIKIGKAQRRRDKKANEQKERDERIRQQEKENVFGVRHKETEAIKKILKERDLMIHEIPSDGNCLYCAILHQVSICSLPDLRKQTAACIMETPEDYLPYLTSKKTHDMMTEEELVEYCKEVATTTAWGGQVEVKALSHVLKCPIEIIQATGPSIILGEEYSSHTERIILCYHRHIYSLGAHYNSVKKLDAEEENDGEVFQEQKRRSRSRSRTGRKNITTDGNQITECDNCKRNTC